MSLRPRRKDLVNPYVSFSIAMCLIVLLSLGVTAYLAVMFNRRAKVDLREALAPLAELVGGEVDVEEARVEGRYAGHLVEGRVARAGEGPGRVFQTSIVDAAGGTSWERTSTPSKQGDEPPRVSFSSADPNLESGLEVAWDRMMESVLQPQADRYRIDYDPASGRLRFQRPMRTRRNIPNAEAFRRQLDLLVALGPANRRAQGAPDADWPGGRRSKVPRHEGEQNL